jgi:hypothetical protein
VKDQYFGDINDYRKYGLLRLLTEDVDFRLGVCWMLTAPDGRTDGLHLRYLQQPDMFRRFDPALYDWLRSTIGEHIERKVTRIETTNLIPGATYFDHLLTDGLEHRTAWFAECCRRLAGCDLVFFDPDNGLERRLVRGRKNSHKYLYWAEVKDIFATGASVLVYQHFPREGRESFVQRLAERMRVETGAAGIFSFRTPHVLLLLAAQERHLGAVRRVAEKLDARWPRKQLAGQERMRE